MENLFPALDVENVWIAEYSVLSIPRSSSWSTFRQNFLKGKKCLLCGSRKNLNAHHLKPFHLFPQLELDENNLIPLCEGGPINCHFIAGHGGKNWYYYHPNPWTVINRLKKLFSEISNETLNS